VNEKYPTSDFAVPAMPVDTSLPPAAK
jgi:hypothetical protein